MTTKKIVGYYKDLSEKPTLIPLNDFFPEKLVTEKQYGLWIKKLSEVGRKLMYQFLEEKWEKQKFCPHCKQSPPKFEKCLPCLLSPIQSNATILEKFQGSVPQWDYVDIPMLSAIASAWPDILCNNKEKQNFIDLRKWRHETTGHRTETYDEVQFGKFWAKGVTLFAHFKLTAEIIREFILSELTQEINNFVLQQAVKSEQFRLMQELQPEKNYQKVWDNYLSGIFGCHRAEYNWILILDRNQPDSFDWVREYPWSFVIELDCNLPIGQALQKQKAFERNKFEYVTLDKRFVNIVMMKQKIDPDVPLWIKGLDASTAQGNEVKNFESNHLHYLQMYPFAYMKTSSLKPYQIVIAAYNDDQSTITTRKKILHLLISDMHTKFLKSKVTWTFLTDVMDYFHYLDNNKKLFGYESSDDIYAKCIVPLGYVNKWIYDIHKCSGYNFSVSTIGPIDINAITEGGSDVFEILVQDCHLLERCYKDRTSVPQTSKSTVIEDLRKEFLQGNTLPWIGCQQEFAAKRDIESKDKFSKAPGLTQIITEALNSCEMRIILLKHHPCSGGTTLARMCAFKLRTKYTIVSLTQPIKCYEKLCRILKRLDEKSRPTKAGILLLIDIPSERSSELAEKLYQQALDFKWGVKFVILQCVYPGNYKESQFVTICELAGNLSEKEMLRFKEKYHHVIKQLWDPLPTKSRNKEDLCEPYDESNDKKEDKKSKKQADAIQMKPYWGLIALIANEADFKIKIGERMIDPVISSAMKNPVTCNIIKLLCLVYLFAEGSPLSAKVLSLMIPRLEKLAKTPTYDDISAELGPLEYLLIRRETKGERYFTFPTKQVCYYIASKPQVFDFHKGNSARNEVSYLPNCPSFFSTFAPIVVSCGIRLLYPRNF